MVVNVLWIILCFVWQIWIHIKNIYISIGREWGIWIAVCDICFVQRLWTNEGHTRQNVGMCVTGLPCIMHICLSGMYAQHILKFLWLWTRVSELFLYCFYIICACLIAMCMVIVFIVIRISGFRLLRQIVNNWRYPLKTNSQK